MHSPALHLSAHFRIEVRRLRSFNACSESVASPDRNLPVQLSRIAGLVLINVPEQQTPGTKSVRKLPQMK
jgi:hypothetical protein